METVTISKDIELSPSSLHQGYFNDIYNNLCDKYRDTCTKDNGYIIDILDDLKLNSNRIFVISLIIPCLSGHLNKIIYFSMIIFHAKVFA